MTYDNLIVTIEERVALIQLDRPDALNALNQELLWELVDALKALDANEKVRAVVLTGNDKAFAAGADIKEMSEKSYADMAAVDYFGPQHNAIVAFQKPLIAAVAGYALGGGCELAMACDIIICADNAKFGQPEVNLGVMPGLGGSQRLTRAVGKSKAMDMCLTGRFMDAEEAERGGLVTRIVPVKTLVDDAKELAGKIADKSPLSTSAIKDAVNRAYEVSLAEGLLFERKTFHGLFATEDQDEGMTAFMEKRTPKFRAR